MWKRSSSEKRSQCSRTPISVQPERLGQRGQVPAPGLGDTTTRSSIRMPPKRGSYSPGSMVITSPTSRTTSASLIRGYSWISRPSPWPGPVDEPGVALDVAVGLGERAVAVLFEDLAACEVDVASVDAGSHHVETGLLRLEHGVPHAHHLRRRRAPDDGAGHVAPVPGALVERVDIEHDRQARTNDLALGPVRVGDSGPPQQIESTVLLPFSSRWLSTAKMRSALERFRRSRTSATRRGSRRRR